MIKTLTLYITYVICYGAGVSSFAYTNRTTFDGHELMILAAVIGFALYLIVFVKREKNLILGLFKAAIFVSLSITATTALNVFSVSDKTFEVSSQIISKEKERLKNRSFSYYLNVNTPNHGERSIWVNEETFNNKNWRTS